MTGQSQVGKRLAFKDQIVFNRRFDLNNNLICDKHIQSKRCCQYATLVKNGHRKLSLHMQSPGR